MTTPTLREQLVNLRQESGVSQAELAQRIGVTQTAVSYWETGQRQPGLDDVERWAAALGATPSLLQGSPTAGSNPLAGDLVGRLTAALLAEPWNPWPKSAHGDHRFDSGCAICQCDVVSLAAFVARFLTGGGQATRKESFPLRDLLRRALKGYDSDIDARAVDALVPVVEAWAVEQTQRAEQAERRLTYRHGEWQREMDARIAAEQKLQEAERERDTTRDALGGAGIIIGSLRDERDEVLAVIRQVRRLHERYRFAGDDTTDYCVECNRLSGGFVPYPCPTLRALDRPETDHG